MGVEEKAHSCYLAKNSLGNFTPLTHITWCHQLVLRLLELRLIAGATSSSQWGFLILPGYDITSRSPASRWSSEEAQYRWDERQQINRNPPASCEICPIPHLATRVFFCCPGTGSTITFLQSHPERVRKHYKESAQWYIFSQHCHWVLNQVAYPAISWSKSRIV